MGFEFHIFYLKLLYYGLTHKLGAFWDCVCWFCSKTQRAAYILQAFYHHPSSDKTPQVTNLKCFTCEQRLVNCLYFFFFLLKPFDHHTFRNFTWRVIMNPGIAFSTKDEGCVEGNIRPCAPFTLAQAVLLSCYFKRARIFGLFLKVFSCFRLNTATVFQRRSACKLILRRQSAHNVLSHPLNHFRLIMLSH